VNQQVKIVTIDYTNWKGSRRVRTILPLELRFMELLPWHPEPCWLIYALDLEDVAQPVDITKAPAKHFALSGIHHWEGCP
jgi:hypothetical protein